MSNPGGIRGAAHETEKALASIWRQFLELTGSGCSDNFFDLGGHSLLAVRVIDKINAKFQTRLGVAAVFHSPTIEIARLRRSKRTSETNELAAQVLPLRSGHNGPPIYFIGAGPARTSTRRTDRQ